MPGDRVFLDANVLFSAAYGSPGLRRLWGLARAGRCRLLASLQVIEEARRNLAPGEQVARLEELLASVEQVGEADPATPTPVALPEPDRLVLLAAVAAGATHLVTGDRQHFGPYFGRRVQGVLVCRPRDPGLPAGAG